MQARPIRVPKFCAAIALLVLLAVNLTAAFAAPNQPPAPPSPSSYAIPSVFIVTNTKDSGAGSLRGAIIKANNNPGTDTIIFNLPGTGVHTIVVGAQLPIITDPVILNGASQPLCNHPCIEISGQNHNAPHGFEIAAGNSTVRGFILNRFGAGIKLRDRGGNVIVGNYIGTNASGTGALPNENGITIDSGGANHIGGLIGLNPGGACQGDCNLISGNSGNGIKLRGPGANGEIIQGNFIGVNASGRGPLGNRQDGILVADSPHNQIGGSTPAARNIISGNMIGIELGLGGAHDNVIQGNYIGTNSAGSGAIPNRPGMYIGGGSASTLIVGNLISGNAEAGVNIAPTAGGRHKFIANRIGVSAGGSALGNGLPGIRISSSNNIVGGTAPGDANTIAFNGQQGVQIEQGTGNSFRLNSVFNNGGAFLGFNLGPGRTQPNDPGDGDGGPNKYQNYPTIKKVVRKLSGLIVRASLNSRPNARYTIDLYLSPACDTKGAGEGKTALGSMDVTTDGSGNVSFRKVFLLSASPGQVVTATATDSAGNTSEFSYCGKVP